MEFPLTELHKHLAAVYFPDRNGRFIIGYFTQIIDGRYHIKLENITVPTAQPTPPPTRERTVNAQWRNGVRRVHPLYSDKELVNIIRRSIFTKEEYKKQTFLNGDKEYNYVHLAVMNAAGPGPLGELIKAGATVSSRDDLHARTPLHWAILMTPLYSDKNNVLKQPEPKEKGRKSNDKHVTAVKLLLENGRKENNEDSYARVRDRSKATALHYAIEVESGFDTVKALLDAGAEVEDTDKDDDTTLHLALRVDKVFPEIEKLHGFKRKSIDLDIVALLLHNKPSVCNLSNNGTLPIHLVAKTSCIKWRAKENYDWLESEDSIHETAVKAVALLVASNAAKLEYEPDKNLNHDETVEVYIALVKFAAETINSGHEVNNQASLAINFLVEDETFLRRLNPSVKGVVSSIKQYIGVIKDIKDAAAKLLLEDPGNNKLLEEENRHVGTESDERNMSSFEMYIKEKFNKKLKVLLEKLQKRHKNIEEIEPILTNLSTAWTEPGKELAAEIGKIQKWIEDQAANREAIDLFGIGMFLDEAQNHVEEQRFLQVFKPLDTMIKSYEDQMQKQSTLVPGKDDSRFVEDLKRLKAKLEGNIEQARNSNEIEISKHKVELKKLIENKAIPLLDTIEFRLRTSGENINKRVLYVLRRRKLEEMLTLKEDLPVFQSLRRKKMLEIVRIEHTEVLQESQNKIYAVKRAPEDLDRPNKPAISDDFDRNKLKDCEYVWHPWCCVPQKTEDYDLLSFDEIYREHVRDLLNLSESRDTPANSKQTLISSSPRASPKSKRKCSEKYNARIQPVLSPPCKEYTYPVEPFDEETSHLMSKIGSPRKT